MSIKSLLLGSAAAMVAVSGAQAADAVIVEPEPVEYVRICDAYGTGFFYIPGTETCIRFSGYVRSSYEKTYLEVTGNVATAGPPIIVTTESEYTFWGQRARLNIDVRNETDWGTLRAQYRLEGGDSNIDTDIDMDRALISLAGFRFGFTDNYWSTNHGYAGVNLTGLGAAFTPASDDGWYGFNDATMIDYTFAADGFSVTVGAEDPRIDLTGLGAAAAFAGGTATAFANFYAGFNWSGDGFGVAFTAVHDSTALDNSGDRGGWAWKVSADLDLSEFIPGGRLHGMYMTDGEYVTNYVHNWLGFADPESIWQVSYQMDLSDEVQMVAQYSHAEGDAAEGSGYSASVGLNWFPAAAPGFSVRGSYKFGELNDTLAAPGAPGVLRDVDFHGFFIGVRRDF